ncbi:hypothetical protein AAFF_G00151310 [Aldrovandia affinis]|uniref:ribonuclease H n=1 Tax=Aldrovandia affinis TaxID=143900 RepID=A0AAD7RP78_9TELE|nr:hypothetical protein AAFF_G00151310 [Aldrovandia affinis]
MLRDLPWLFIYLDDILIASTSRTEHVSHLRTLFGCLSQHGLIVNPAKCQFGLSMIGHQITKDKTVPLLLKVEALMRSLYKALKGKSAKLTVGWSEEMTKAFTDTKQTFANVTLLAHLLPNAPIALTTDTSDYAVGTMQLVNGAWQPLTFLSRQLRPNKWKYSTFNGKLLGL